VESGGGRGRYKGHEGYERLIRLRIDLEQIWARSKEVELGDDEKV
jgi:hypothetical protein